MKYLCYYDVNDKQNRKYVLSATNKIDYIISALQNIDAGEIEIVSASSTKNSKPCRGRNDRLREGLSLKLFFSLGMKNRFISKVDSLLMNMQLFFYLLFKLKKNETMIVYHSLSYVKQLLILKKIKKFRLVLEFEEMYADLSGKESDRIQEMELTQYADGFIFPTQLLEGLINKKSVPSVVIHGTYRVEENYIDNATSDKNGVINCVYAGTFDPRKGGLVAVGAAKYLPSNYHLHILGFGNRVETENMKRTIENVSKTSKASVSYDGLLSGEDYIKFIQRCSVGISPQDPDAVFNSTSFPSKILSYLANGLRVVSIRIPAIEKSAVGDLLYFYDEQTPKSIADAIMSVNINDNYDSKLRIRMLSDIFEEELKKII